MPTLSFFGKGTVLPALRVDLFVVSFHIRRTRGPRKMIFCIYILLHDWAGSMGKYSVRGWQYWPDRREGQYIT